MMKSSGSPPPAPVLAPFTARALQLAMLGCLLLLLLLQQHGAGAKASAGAKQAGPRSSFTLNGSMYSVYASDNGRPYYYNHEDKSTTWTDPRKVAAQEEHHLTAFFMFLTPFFTLLLLGGAYITYIMIKEPKRLQKPRKHSSKHSSSRQKSSSSTSPITHAASPSRFAPKQASIEEDVLANNNKKA